MNVKHFLCLALFVLAIRSGWSAPQPYPAPRPGSGEDWNGLIRQFKTAIADLRHEGRNHESEIRIFEEKLHNQEGAFEELRQQLAEDVQTQRDFARASAIHLEGITETLSQSLTNLEALVRGIMSDVRQIKAQANDSVNVLAQYKQKIAELEQIAENQNQHMQALEAALQSIMDLWQAKEASREASREALREGMSKETDVLKNYKVQPGDTLEKIARAQKVPLQALREVNQLTHDRIIVGQTLKIPVVKTAP